jgi:hypothetical protein
MATPFRRASRRNEPLPELNLSLHAKQGVAFTTTATEILYGGAAGGGKSHLMRVAAIAWCHAVPGLQVYIFRRTLPDLKLNHLSGPTSLPELLAPWIDARYVRFNENDHVFKFANGSAIHLCHCQHEKDVRKYQGAEIHVLMIDELTHFSEAMYRYLRGRARLGGLKLPPQYAGLFPRVLCGSNPGGIGHNWVKRTYIDFAPEGVIARQAKEEGGMLRQFIRAMLIDNPTMEGDYQDKLSGLGDPALVKAMLEGDWNIVSGGMFDDLWNARIHVIKPFAIPKNWRIDRSFDWGSSAPFSVGWWAEANGEDVILPDGRRLCFPKGTLFRIAEWYGWSGKDNEGCKMTAATIAKGIKEREKSLGFADRVRPGPADTQIYTKVNANCIADDMAAEKVTWTMADKGPGSRVNGCEIVRQRLEASLAVPMEKPGLFVFESCRHFVRTVPVLPRAANNNDDVDSDAEDHVFDETRYRVTAPPPPFFQQQSTVA